MEIVVTQWATAALQNHKASKSLLSTTDAEALKPNEKVTATSSSSSSRKKLSSLFIAKTLTSTLPTTHFTKAKVKKTEVLDDAWGFRLTALRKQEEKGSLVLSLTALLLI